MQPYHQPWFMTPRGVWQTAATHTFTADSNAWNGFNLRQTWNNTILADLVGSRVRITMTAGSTEGVTISNMYIGHVALAGDTYDFDGNQVKVMFNGSGTKTIAAGGTGVTEDILFPFDGTKSFIAAAYFNSAAADNLRGLASTVANANAFFLSAADQCATTNVTGYALTASSVRLFNKIEVLA